VGIFFLFGCWNSWILSYMSFSGGGGASFFLMFRSLCILLPVLILSGSLNDELHCVLLDSNCMICCISDVF
jgi:hypothetical protein